MNKYHSSSTNEDQPPIAGEPSSDPCAPSDTLIPFLTRTVLLLAVLLALRFIVPSILEEMQYALTRGRQRAEFEVAGAALESAPLDRLSFAYQMVSQRVAPSVVHIEATMEHGATTVEDEMSHLGFPSIATPSEHNQGSGVIVSQDGYVLTNMHVVASTQRIVVTLSDGRAYHATPIGADRLTDLAVLKIEAENLIAAEWGDSDELEEGALVWAVGSPFGFQHSITSGIVSAKNRGGRAGTAYQDFLQTDAAVNPGNSGGPLVDSHGAIIGINTMIVGPSFQGISLAIPSKVARSIYRKLRTDGRVERGWLGIALNQLTPQVARLRNISVTTGAMVTQLVSTPGFSPAADAGIRPYDVILEFDGQHVATTAALSRSIAERTVGERIQLVVLRDGKQVSLNVTIGQRPSEYN